MYIAVISPFPFRLHIKAVLTANDSDKLELPSIPLLPKQNSTLNSLTNAMEGVMDIKGGDSKDAGKNE